MRPDPEEAKAVQNMKEPTNIGELKSFLGMVNQLCKFIPNLAEKDKTLRDFLSKKVIGSGTREHFQLEK